MKPPNTTPTTLRECLEDFAASISPVVIMGALNKNPYAKPQFIDQATQSIQKDLLDLLPEKLESGRHIFDEPPYNPDANGFNQAIDQLRQAIIAYCGGESKNE